MKNLFCQKEFSYQSKITVQASLEFRGFDTPGFVYSRFMISPKLLHRILYWSCFLSLTQHKMNSTRLIINQLQLLTIMQPRISITHILVSLKYDLVAGNLAYGEVVTILKFL